MKQYDSQWKGSKHTDQTQLALCTEFHWLNKGKIALKNILKLFVHIQIRSLSSH